jgi:hypothetical protein
MTSKLVPAFICALLMAAAPSHAQSPEEKGQKIAVDAHNTNAGWATERSQLTMLLVSAQGDQTTRKLNIDTRELANDGDRSRVTFEWPADVKGTRMLTWSHKDGNDDQWLYLPAIKRVKRISASDKSGSFMGSEVAYEDLGSQEPEKYRYKWLADAKENGRDCWQLERVPVSKTSGYARHVVWMDKEWFLPVHIDYYDRKNELLKTSLYSGHQKYGKTWRVNKIEVANVQTKKKTVLTWTDRQFGVKLDPVLFESSALED